MSENKTKEMDLQKEDAHKIEAGPSHKWVNRSIEDASGCFSKLIFAWTNKIVEFGNKKPMEDTDLFELRHDLKYEYSWPLFKKHYEESKKKGKPSINKSLYAMCKGPLILGMILNFVGNLLQFAGPYLLKEVVKFVSRPNIPTWKGYLWAILLFLAFLTKTILVQQGFHQLNTVAFRSASSMQALVMDKLLKLKSSARGFLTTGKIINLSTIDAFSVYGFFQIATMVITQPFMIIVSIALIVIEVGPIGFVGLFIIIVGTYVSSYISDRYSKSRKQMLVYSDKRSKSLAEFISGIRVIKYYGWEKFVVKRIQEIRYIETKLLLIGTFLKAALDLAVNLIPLGINIAVFGLYVAMGNDLTPAKAYATLALFNIIQGPIRMISFVILGLSNTNVSLKRVQHYTEWEELEKIDINDQSIPKGSIFIENGTFSWETETARQHWENYQENFEKKKKKYLSKEVRIMKIFLEACRQC